MFSQFTGSTDFLNYPTFIQQIHPSTTLEIVKEYRRIYQTSTELEGLPKRLC